MESAQVREALLSQFAGAVKEMPGGVLRIERRFHDTPYAVAYVDLADAVPQRSRELESFQERLLGEEYFAGSSSLRWNNYLLFWAGPKSSGDTEFAAAKTSIESDRHYARKYVLKEDELLDRLQPTAKLVPAVRQLPDVTDTWAKILSGAALEALLAKPTKKDALEQICDGTLFQPPTRQPTASAKNAAGPLNQGQLGKISIGKFRPAHAGKTYNFSRVNLIVGPNGSGKTSLLEAIELLYTGRVRRDEGAEFEAITATVLLANGSSQNIAATTSPATLKARSMEWYGRSDFQSSSLSLAFTRFNFLDTDAAFRLALDASASDVSQDLTKLLAGPEATSLSNYLSSLLTDIDSNVRSLDKRLADMRTTQDVLKANVQRLKAEPSRASVLTADFYSSLLALRPLWQINPELPLEPGVRARLDSVRRSLSIVIHACAGRPPARATLQQSLEEIRRTIEELSKLETSGQELETKLSFDRDLLVATQRQLESLEGWNKLLSANVPEKATRLQELQQSTNALRKKLSTATIPSVLAPEFQTESLDEALKSAKQAVSVARETETAAASTASRQNQLHDTLSSLRAQLSEIARSLIRQTGDEEHCPVCKTPHSPDELLNKLEKLVDSPDTAALTRAEQTLGLAREQVRAAQANLNTLMAMSSLASALQIPSLLTAAEVLARIKQEQRELDDQVLLLGELESYFSNLHSDLNWRAWAAARSVAAQNCPPDVDLDDLESVTRAADAAAKSSSECEERLESHRVTLAGLYDQAFALTKRYVPALEGTFDELIEAIRQVETQVDQGLAALEEVGNQFVLDPEVQLDVLRGQVEEVSLAYERAVSACNAEAESQRSIKEAEEKLAQATTNISAAESQSANLKQVQGVLAPMLKQYSVEAATAEAFAGIRDAISATFALIHAPREYELGALNGPEGPFLKKTDDGAVHTFQQVSTGQRAALALSIFLASHESASKAPPVLLIDDPVAHVDDLNALSFLDYLRDLAVERGRQIFFATSDTRLAGLFQKKFEFLGPKAFTRLNLSHRN